MIINAVTRLHYGIDYLPWVVRSTRRLADKHILLYNHHPSFRPGRDRPEWLETRQQMHDVLFDEDKDRVRWIENEPISPHTVHVLYPETDVIVELDADEVISPQLVKSIHLALASGVMQDRMYRMPMIHHWRCFDYICKNPGWPKRLFMPKNSGSDEAYFQGGYDVGVYHHFGYCRKRRAMEYKWELSMHLPELRQDWWEKKYDAFPDELTDLHPCVFDMWNAEKYDKQQMLEYMGDHPYFELEKVD